LLHIIRLLYLRWFTVGNRWQSSTDSWDFCPVLVDGYCGHFGYQYYFCYVLLLFIYFYLPTVV